MGHTIEVKGGNDLPHIIHKMISLVQDPKFMSAIEGLQSFVFDTTADIDMAYDWVCEQAGISTFVADNIAWDLFYEMYQTSAQDAGVPDHIIAGDYRY